MAHCSIHELYHDVGGPCPQCIGGTHHPRLFQDLRQVTEKTVHEALAVLALARGLQRVVREGRRS